VEYLLTNTIYRHDTKTASTKRQPTTRYAYEDDPTFLQFRSAVWAACKTQDQPYIDNSKLYALWYVSATFHRHWDEQPSKKTSNDMVYILGHNFLTDVQSRIVMLAWLKCHFPNLSAAKFEEWEERMFWPTWERIQASILAARDRKNARRRQKRRMKKMKNTKQTYALKNRILDALKLHPMTTAVLAAKLNAHPKALDGHLSRMSKADRAEVVKLGRGLYALAGADYGVRTQPTMPVSQEPRVEPVFSTDITEGVDEWKEPSVPEYRNSYATVDILDEDAVCVDAPELKSAEPRWSRGW